MHHEKVYGLFEHFEDAASVISELTRGGYPSENITVIVNDKDGRLEKYTSDAINEDDVKGDEGAGFGAVVGTLTALGMAVLPGVGPVFAAGPLAAAFIAGIGAATGAATGAVVAEAVEFDIDKDDANEYARIIQNGGAVLVVDVYDDWDEERVEDIMEKYNPLRVDDTD